MKPLILFVDNHIAFLDDWAEWLERKGCRVFRAYNFREAERILRTQHVHLVIIDIRLRDDLNESDISGLALARDEEFSAIPKIILTRYPTAEAVKTALGPRLGQLPPAVRFVSKVKDPQDKKNRDKEPKEVLLSSVKEVLAEWVRIDWDLGIDSSNSLSLAHLVDRIEGTSAAELLFDRAEELEDLFRKLFFDYRQLTLGRPFSIVRGQVILEVTAFDKKGFEQSFLISCGQRRWIQKEVEAYKSLVADSMERSLMLADTAETMHFAAATYRLPNTALDEATTFRTFYERNPAEIIQATLDQLYSYTLADLHEEDRRFDSRDLRAAFDAALRRRELVLGKGATMDRVRKLCQKGSTAGLIQAHNTRDRLTFKFPDGSRWGYSNPIPPLFDTTAEVTWSTTYGRIHGWVNADNVLVDRLGQTLIINFSRTTHGPVVEDFVSLELAIRLDLLTADQPASRYLMEERLLSAPGLGEDIGTEELDTDSQKAVQVITHIRRRAAGIPGLDQESYLMGLLFGAAAYLAGFDSDALYTRRQLLPYVHCLFLMAMLGEKLIPQAQIVTGLPKQAMTGLWLSDEHSNEAVVESSKVKLSPGDYVLLHYLYNRKNQVCKYQDIAIDVYQYAHPEQRDKFVVNKHVKEQIYAAISRLLSKIERDPKHPKYIENIRGVGYRLNLPEDEL